MTGLTLILLLLLPPLAPVLLPRRWALLGCATLVLLLGLLWLDAHGRPITEDGDRFGLGTLLMSGWLLLTTVTIALVVARRREAEPAPALWPLPLGTLGAVFFFHWLANCVAGATPAWAVHVLAATAALAFAGPCWAMRPPQREGRDVVHVGVVAGLVLALLVGKAALDARRWTKLALATAGDRPHCVLTFAARGRPRAARTTLELSPLVSRSSGRSFVDDAHWLVTAGPNERVIAHRWDDGSPGRGHFSDRPVAPPLPCAPRTGGALR